MGMINQWQSTPRQARMAILQVRSAADPRVVPSTEQRDSETVKH